MASLLTHALAAGALAQAGRPEWLKSRKFWAAAVVCSMLPDVDVIGMRMGVPYGTLWGHRGLTHSLLFAVIVAGIAAAVTGETAVERWKAWALLFCITASHGALDAMTNGGLGIAFYSPFDTHRYFFPWRPIEVAPIGLRGFLTARGARVMWSEIVWLWGPIMAAGAALWRQRVRGKQRMRAAADEHPGN